MDSLSIYVFVFGLAVITITSGVHYICFQFAFICLHVAFSLLSFTLPFMS